MTGYKEITSVDEWKEVLKLSDAQKILVLKHSTTCPISARAFREFESFDTPLEKYLVKVRESRSVSNEMESDLGVKHESPQVFLVGDGKAVWNASHHQINRTELAIATKSS
ncbi:MAG: bacillithiol system redox-active protein YtxJ [Psychrobacillus sp.]|uniref:bacillithiol system redox-active protein YtxJ n=1 Tax=Psychrobacillus sp. MER TA 171 TaxID=2939577 RepID=UPI00203A58A1|nr:bacillithiol system redox-active protein YtxJ [Psychrobacillus sp. MER TA 171]